MQRIILFFFTFSVLSLHGQNRIDIADQLQTGAQGDIVVLDAGGKQIYLNIGTAGQVLTVNSGGTTVEWATPAVNANNGLSVDGTSVQIGHAAAGTGSSDFTRTNYLYMGGFDLVVGGADDNAFIRMDGSAGTMGLGANGVSLILHHWSSTNTDLDGLIDDTSVGGLIQGANTGHLTLGLRDNSINDSWGVYSGGGNYTTDQTYDTELIRADADGEIFMPNIDQATEPNALYFNSTTGEVTYNTIAVLSANNGLSLDGTNVQLGQSAAGAGTSTFLNNRYIDQSTFDLFFETDVSTNTFFIDGGLGRTGFGTSSPDVLVNAKQSGTGVIVSIDETSIGHSFDFNTDANNLWIEMPNGVSGNTSSFGSISTNRAAIRSKSNSTNNGAGIDLYNEDATGANRWDATLQAVNSGGTDGGDVNLLGYNDIIFRLRQLTKASLNFNGSWTWDDYGTGSYADTDDAYFITVDANGNIQEELISTPTATFVNSAYNVTSADCDNFLMVSTASSSVTITLPDASTFAIDCAVKIKVINENAANTMTITSTSGTIDGNATKTMVLNESVEIRAYNSNWYIF